MPPPSSEICPFSLHDALPIWKLGRARHAPDAIHRIEKGAERRSRAERPRSDVQQRREHECRGERTGTALPNGTHEDRKSTRLNSSHLVISYAVFCLQKKNKA